MSPSASLSPEQLAPITITPSRLLWHLERWILAITLISATLVLSSQLPLHPLVAVIWLLLCLWLLHIYRQKRNLFQQGQQSFWVFQGRWYWRSVRGEFWVKPEGEILLWSWLIILPLREALSGKLHHVLLTQDALSQEDWRRLRVWLRLVWRPD